MRDALIREFVGLKNELLQKMSPKECVFLWRDPLGNGIALTSDDTLVSKYVPQVSLSLGPCEPQDLITSFRDKVSKSLTDEECLKMANQRLRQAIQECPR